MTYLYNRIITVIIFLSYYMVSYAYDFEKDGLYYNMLSDTTVECCGGGRSPMDDTYRQTEVTIPSTVEKGLKTYKVVKVADYAWGQGSQSIWIKNLVLPNTVTEIGDGAFRYANNIESINMPTGLIKIGNYALQGPKIAEYVFPKSLKYIGIRAFNPSLKTVVFTSSNAPSIAEESFAYQNGGMDDVFIPAGFKMYVPCLQSYSSIGYYEDYMSPIVIFSENRFKYSGDKPDVNYTVDLPNNHKLKLDIEEIPIDAGNYDLVLSGKIDESIEMEIPINLLIDKAELYISVQDYTRQYGDKNPSFMANISGLQKNEDINDVLTNGYHLYTNAIDESDVGKYPIMLSSDVSSNYIVTFQQGTLNVTKAPIIVVAEDKERIYGDENPRFTRLYKGFKLNDTENSAFTVFPKTTCAATKTSDFGKYAIVVEGGVARNYEIVKYDNGTLSVTKAPLKLTANDKSRLYYETNPQFDFTLTGLKNNDTEECLMKSPIFNCIAGLTANAGQYQIIPSDADAKNYILEYGDGILTVNQRPLTASVGNYTRKYNGENPIFEVVYTGFVNDEDASVLFSYVNVSCDATKASDVGTYAITPFGGSAINYVISNYVNGTLTIEKSNQKLSWDQDLSNVDRYSQIALNATSDANLPVSYEMSPNNVASLYENAGTWYLDCYGSGAVNIRAVQYGDKNHNSATILTKTLVVAGSGNQPSSPQIYFNVEKAGTLSALIAENRKYQIKNLRLTGYLNGTDINYLREMAGSDSEGKETPGILETLDISECTIVSGGRSYYYTYRTSDNKVSDYMFFNCKTLVNLHLPNKATNVGAYALADCDRLSVLSLPNSVTSFGPYAFQNDISLLRMPMPKNLVTIGKMAFYGCNGITELTIPQYVREIGDGILMACENIARINVESGNTNFNSQDGVLYSYSYDELCVYPANRASEDYTVREGVVRIAPYAFINAKNLNIVDLPSTLTSIGADAFMGCINLKTLFVRALTPPACQNDCFEIVSKTRCELCVPNGCYSYYWAAPVWSEFNKSTEFDFSGIGGVSYTDVEVMVEDHNIVIKNLPENIQVMIFKINGSLVYQTLSTGNPIYYCPDASDVYIVALAGQIYKVMVR